MYANPIEYSNPLIVNEQTANEKNGIIAKTQDNIQTNSVDKEIKQQSSARVFDLIDAFSEPPILATENSFQGSILNYSLLYNFVEQGINRFPKKKIFENYEDKKVMNAEHAFKSKD